jgi:hypothetical protein
MTLALFAFALLWPRGMKKKKEKKKKSKNLNKNLI